MKLNEGQKKEIRKRYVNRLKAKKDTLDAIAKEYKVSVRTIWLAIQEKA